MSRFVDDAASASGGSDDEVVDGAGFTDDHGFIASSDDEDDVGNNNNHDSHRITDVKGAFDVIEDDAEPIRGELLQDEDESDSDAEGDGDEPVLQNDAVIARGHDDADEEYDPDPDRPIQNVDQLHDAVAEDIDLSTHELVANYSNHLLLEMIPDDVDASTLHAYIEATCRLWCPRRESTIGDTQMRIDAMFCYNEQGVRDESVDSIKGKFQRWMQHIVRLHVLLEDGPNVICESEDQVKVMDERIVMASTCIYHAFHSVQNLRLMRAQGMNEALIGPARAGLDVMMNPHRTGELKGIHKAILHYFSQCRELALWRHGEDLYEPVYTDSMEYTFSLRRRCTIDEFIFECMSPREHNQELFYTMFEKSNVIPMVRTALTKTHERDLPEVKVNRYLFSFKNGVYNTKNATFYPYKPDAETGICANSMLDPNEVAVKYVDEVFDFKKYEKDSAVYYKVDDIQFENADEDKRFVNSSGQKFVKSHDYFRVETPTVEQIMDDQDWEEEVKRWKYVMLGRLFYPVGVHDHWEVFMMSMGIAGTGKSTIFKLVSEFFMMKDIGIMANEGREQFQLENLYQKLIFFCYEVNERMNFKMTRFNSIVSAEPVLVERMYKTSQEMEAWRVPGAWAGNAFPPFMDQGGNQSRRLIIFHYAKVVSQTDPNLFKKLLDERPAFLYKCTRLYLEKAESLDIGLWTKTSDPEDDPLPKYFHDTRSMLQAKANPMMAFLNDCTDITISADAWCNLTDFRKKFYEWAEEASHGQEARKIMSNKSSWQATCTRKGIAVKDSNRGSGHPEGASGAYLVGVSMELSPNNNDNDDVPNDSSHFE